MLTLIARVQMAAITSSEPPRTRLSCREGSYSQMAVAFSTTAIFVICSITSTFPRFTTWPRQLREDQRDNIKDKEKMYSNYCENFTLPPLFRSDSGGLRRTLAESG